MAEYIEREALIKKLNEAPAYFDSGDIRYGIDIATQQVIEQPTADVVEVKHGTWYHGTEHGAVYAKCSACGRKMNYSCYGYAYCALCGARMGGEQNAR